MLASGFRCFRGISIMPGGHHSQFLQPNWRPAQLAAKILTTMPRQKKTKAQAFAGQPVRLPKPALLEFAQQLERVEVAPSLGFSAREASDSTPAAPMFEATVTLSSETFGSTLNELQYTATARSKKAAEHAAAMEALVALAAAGQLGRPLALEVEAMQARAQAAEALAKAAAQADRQAVVPVSPKELLRPTPEHLQHLQAALGYRFSNVDLLREACIHPSSDAESNNDRLALLGDRVLDLIVLQQGMKHRPSATNLELNTYKAMRVSRRRCVGYAARLGLEPCIQTAVGFRRSDGGPGPEDSMLAEAFEAVLGAMFQDAGGSGEALEVVRKFWETQYPYSEMDSGDTS